MLEQISPFHSKFGDYLHRAKYARRDIAASCIRSPHRLEKITSALNKVYQRKGVNISLIFRQRSSFVGEQNDFVEAMGNVLDNAL
ncbi:hypothetical protein ACLK17_07035 [Escherichia coli]